MLWNQVKETQDCLVPLDYENNKIETTVNLQNHQVWLKIFISLILTWRAWHFYFFPSSKTSIICLCMLLKDWLLFYWLWYNLTVEILIYIFTLWFFYSPWWLFLETFFNASVETKSSIIQNTMVSPKHPIIGHSFQWTHTFLPDQKETNIRYLLSQADSETVSTNW